MVRRPGSGGVPVKGLTLYQPYAGLIASGAKKIETRSWPTSYRGPVAIHAGRSIDQGAFEVGMIHKALAASGMLTPHALPRGAIVAVADLVDVQRMVEYNRPSPLDAEYWFGDYTPGRFMWYLANVRRLSEPVPCKGALGLWMVPPEIEALIT